VSLLHRTTLLSGPFALSGLLLSATATADPGASQNIPATAASSAEPPPSSAAPERAAQADELPLPYAPWLGKGPEPPADAPAFQSHPPLARAKEWRRRSIELTGALALFLPNCQAGSIDGRGCITVAPSSGAELSLLYRPGPYFAAGVEALASGFAARSAEVRSSAGGHARFFGVVGRVYFAENGRWDPYVGLTLGGGSLTLQTGDDAAATSGFGARVSAGLDVVLGSNLRLGPTAAFTHWLTSEEETCVRGVCQRERAAYGRLVGFATLGFRLTGAFGDVL
jgi:hypothetical protein